MVNEIVESNLAKMIGNEEGDMQPLLAGESMGSGNAGHWNGLQCMGANFHLDSKGEIQLFGNPQDIPEDIRDKYSGACLRVAIDTKETWKCRIVRMVPHNGAQITDYAIKNVLKAVNRYNNEYGFNPED